MLVFCTVSVDEAIKAWISQQHGNANKDTFWSKLAEICKNSEGKQLYQSTTLRKYMRGQHAFSHDHAQIIKDATLTLGLEFRFQNQRPSRQIFDPELLNLSVIATKHDHPAGAAAPNFIEPDAVHELALSARVDHGARRIEFGSGKDEPSLYTARVRVTQGSIAIQTNKAGVKRTSQEEQNTSARGSGDARDLQSYSWVLDDIPEKNGSLDIALGNWHGYFSMQDVATFSASREHISPSDIRYKFGGEMTVEDLKAELTPEMAQAIDARITKVLTDALQEQSPQKIELARVPLFPDFGDDL